MESAYPLWDELAAESGEELLVRCGGFFFSPEGQRHVFEVISNDLG